MSPQRKQGSWLGLRVDPRRLRLRVTRHATRSTGPSFQCGLRLRCRLTVLFFAAALHRPNENKMSDGEAMSDHQAAVLMARSNEDQWPSLEACLGRAAC